jgi:hypothetical protein
MRPPAGAAAAVTPAAALLSLQLLGAEVGVDMAAAARYDRRGGSAAFPDVIFDSQEIRVCDEATTTVEGKVKQRDRKVHTQTSSDEQILLE